MKNNKRVTEVTLRITQTDEYGSGDPARWDWPTVIGSDGETEYVELVKARRIQGDNKMRFLVGVREVHVSTVEVEAESPEEAMRLVQDGDGEEIMREYSHTLDPDLWTVEEKYEE
jgi:hypothetical protein